MKNNEYRSCIISIIINYIFRKIRIHFDENSKKKNCMFFTVLTFVQDSTRQLEMPIRRKPGVCSKCKLHKPKVLR